MKALITGFFCLCPSLLATVAVVASPACVGGVGGNTTAPATTTGANLITINLSSAGSGVSDSNSNTWTALTSQTGSSGTEIMYYSFNPIVGVGHTFSTGTAFSSICVIAFSGVPATLFQQQGANDGGSLTTTATTPPVGVAAGGLMVAGISFRQSVPDALTVSAGWTITSQVPFTGGTFFGNSTAWKLSTGTTDAATWTNPITFVGNAQSLAGFGVAIPLVTPVPHRRGSVVTP